VVDEGALVFARLLPPYYWAPFVLV